MCTDEEIIRTAKDVFLASSNKRLGKRQFYNLIMSNLNDINLTHRRIAKTLADSGLFQIKIYNGNRHYVLSNGIKETSIAKKWITEQIVSKLYGYSIAERLKRINSLIDAGEIKCKFKEHSLIDILCIKSNVLFENVPIGE